jgi:hypothetical protein
VSIQVQVVRLAIIFNTASLSAGTYNIFVRVKSESVTVHVFYHCSLSVTRTCLRLVTVVGVQVHWKLEVQFHFLKLLLVLDHDASDST